MVKAGILGHWHQCLFALLLQKKKMLLIPKLAHNPQKVKQFNILMCATTVMNNLSLSTLPK